MSNGGPTREEKLLFKIGFLAGELLNTPLEYMEVGDFIRLCAECCPLCQNRGEAAPCANCYHAGTLAWCAQLREVAFACAGCMFQATTRREVGLHCAGCRFYHAATMGHVDGADAWLRNKVPRIQQMSTERTE